MGCAGLPGKLGNREALRLVETAIDCGVTYFDTARLYGYGRAEHILGQLTAAKRSKLIIATKAGILPPKLSLVRRLVRRGVRLAHQGAPTLRDYVSEPAAPPLRSGIFEPRAFQNSVDASLRALRTDCVDILLLHECTITDLSDNEQLLPLLQALKKRRKDRTSWFGDRN